MKKFDPTKPVQTRDGHPARIICDDAKGNEYTVVALVDVLDDGVEEVRTFDANGRYFSGVAGSRDLVNIPQKVTKWNNVFVAKHNGAYFSGDLFDTEEEAKLHAAGLSTVYSDYITTVPLTFELP